MPDNLIDRLVETFRRFPGIGPRQARRFVYHLLHEGRTTIDRFVTDLRALHGAVTQCEQCFRFYSSLNRQELAGRAKICDLCADPSRDGQTLMIVEKDADLEAVKQSGTYQGRFFVLGGLVPILEKDLQFKIHRRELIALITRRLVGNEPDKLNEVIIALAVNPEGDHTVEFLKQSLGEFTKKGLRLTVLGRGLSTGTELESSDAETIKNALRNRSSQF